MKKKNTLIAILAILGVMLITTGVTYAVFVYGGNGETLSTVTVGSITFQYKEEQGKGQGINITNAFPVESNDDAMESDDYFEFTINSTTTETVKIPYTVTARMSSESDSILADVIDLYLTEDNEGYQATDLFTSGPVIFDYLDDYDGRSNEKIIYTGEIPAGYDGDAKRFRLRMWMDQNATLTGEMETKYFCGNEDVTDEVENDYNYKCDGEDGTISPSKRNVMGSDYNNKSFSITVNVYATGELAPHITDISIGGVSTSNAPAGSPYQQQVSIPASNNGDILTQVDEGDASTYVNVTRMNEDFTNEYYGLNYEQNSKVKRASTANMRDYLEDYLDQDGMVWGTLYLKFDLINYDTDEIMNSVNVKVVIQKPTFTLNNLKIKNAGKASRFYADNREVDLATYKSVEEYEEIWVDDPTDEYNGGHYDTIHHEKRKVEYPESQSKFQNPTKVSGEDYDYELIIPKDTKKIVMDYNVTGDSILDYRIYKTNSTFDDRNDYYYSSSEIDIGNTGDAYIMVEGSAYNKYNEEPVKSVKIKLTRTTNNSFLSTNWYE